MSSRPYHRQTYVRVREIVRENSSLRAEAHRLRQEVERLEAANAELRVERDALDVLLGEAMDAALGRP